MANDLQERNGSTSAMRWTARVLALVAVGLFVYFAVDFGGTVFPTLSWGPQGIPLLVAVVVALAGVLVAWRWELVGGIMAVAGVAGIMALVCLGSGMDMLFCAFLFTLPLLLAGVLYLGCCWRTKSVKVAQES
ncbi:MAG: hypothetical protein ACK2UA_08745 [Anaerolineae bacterium]|jgi:hypothetical protein